VTLVTPPFAAVSYVWPCLKVGGKCDDKVSARTYARPLNGPPSTNAGGANPVGGALGRHFGWQFNDARDQSVQRDCASDAYPRRRSSGLAPNRYSALTKIKRLAGPAILDADALVRHSAGARGRSHLVSERRVPVSRTIRIRFCPRAFCEPQQYSACVPQHLRGDAPCTLLKSLSSVIAWSWRTLVGTLLSRPTTAKVATTSRTRGRSDDG
jgi:hypothetical protein